MHKIVNPKQIRLFDPFDSVLTEKTRKRLLDGWPGGFRHVILELMPVGAVSGHFDPTMGRPTKELYSIAGLLLIKKFINRILFKRVLHWTLDVCFGEDNSRVRIENAAENLSRVRRIALMLLKQEKTAKMGVKGKRMKAAYDREYLLKVLHF